MNILTRNVILILFSYSYVWYLTNVTTQSQGLAQLTISKASDYVLTFVNDTLLGYAGGLLTQSGVDVSYSFNHSVGLHQIKILCLSDGLVRVCLYLERNNITHKHTRTHAHAHHSQAHASTHTNTHKAHTHNSHAHSKNIHFCIYSCASTNIHALLHIGRVFKFFKLLLFIFYFS